MARLEERDYVYFNTVRSFCGTCRQPVPARVFFRSGTVWQQSLCPRCASIPVLIASDQDWYLRETQKAFPSHAPLPGAIIPQNGCPRDCGPCTWHAARCKSVEVTASSPYTMHDAVESLASVSIERLYVQYQGKDKAAVLRECMAGKATQIVLRWPGDNELDGLPITGIDVVLSPRKADAATRLTAAGVRVELEASLDETGSALLELLRDNAKISGLTITAKGVPVDRAVRNVCEQSGGVLTPGDFRPDDAAHPLCWLAAQCGEPPRTVAVHAIMDQGAFDCFRALLCPHWALVRPGLMAPACTVGFIYREN